MTRRGLSLRTSALGAALWLVACATANVPKPSERERIAGLNEPSCRVIAQQPQADQRWLRVRSDPMSAAMESRVVPFMSNFGGPAFESSELDLTREECGGPVGWLVRFGKCPLMPIPDYSPWREAACLYALGQMTASKHLEWERTYAQELAARDRGAAQAQAQEKTQESIQNLQTQIQLQTP